MVICNKCFFKLKNESNGVCTYKGNKEADKIHAWMDYKLFREKIIPVFREYITKLQEEDKKDQIKFNKNQREQIEHLEKLEREQIEHLEKLEREQIESYNKQQDEFKKKYNEYLNNELPREVEKKRTGLLNKQLEYEAFKNFDIKKDKQNAKRTLLLEGIGFAVGFFIIFIWIIPKFDFGTVFNYFSLIIGLFVVFTITSLRKFLKSKHYTKSRLQELYAESQSFREKLSAKLNKYSDELKEKWHDNNNSEFHKFESGVEAEKAKLKSDIEAKKAKLESSIEEEKRKFEDAGWKIRQRIETVERALNGNDDDLVNFLKDENKNKNKNWYIESFYK